MRRKYFAVVLATMMIICPIVTGQRNDKDRSWKMDFYATPDELATTGRNRYFILEPGFELVLEDGNEQLVVAVTDETSGIQILRA